MEQQPLHVILGDLNKTPDEILSRKRQPVIDLSKTVDVGNVSALDFGMSWKINDIIMNYVNSIGKRAKLFKDVLEHSNSTKDQVDVDIDHSERLQEIYGKFLHAFEHFKDKHGIIMDVGDLTKPFEPEMVKAKLANAAQEEESKTRKTLVVPEPVQETEEEDEEESGVQTEEQEDEEEEVNEYIIPDEELLQVDFEVEDVGHGD